MALWAGVANRWVRSLSPDLGGDIVSTKRSNETDVRHSVRSETYKVRHSCGGGSYYVTFYLILVINWLFLDPDV